MFFSLVTQELRAGSAVKLHRPRSGNRHRAPVDTPHNAPRGGLQESATDTLNVP